MGSNVIPYFKVALATSLLLALWMAGGFFVFLLMPGFCELPLYWGPLSGILVFLLQLICGEHLVVGLLRWTDSTERSREMGSRTKVIDNEMPLVLRWHGLCFTRGFLRVDCSAESIQDWANSSLKPYESFFLANMLALPCILRAFEAVTNSYGSLRLSEGPLWYLGRFFANIANIIEWPLRLFWEKKRCDCELKRTLIEAIGELEKLPAWARALDLMGPVSIAEIVRIKRWRAMFGEQSENIPPECDYIEPYWAVWIGSLLGVILAVSPYHLWGAVPMGIGLGLISRQILYYQSLKKSISWENMANISSFRGATVAVNLRGCLEKMPVSMAYERVRYGLRSSKGVVAIKHYPGNIDESWIEAKSEVEVRGWLSAQRLELRAEDIAVGDKRKRGNHMFKICLAPIVLSSCGLAWIVLQIVGL